MCLYSRDSASHFRYIAKLDYICFYFVWPDYHSPKIAAARTNIKHVDSGCQTAYAASYYRLFWFDICYIWYWLHCRIFTKFHRRELLQVEKIGYLAYVTKHMLSAKYEMNTVTKKFDNVAKTKCLHRWHDMEGISNSMNGFHSWVLAILRVYCNLI